MLDLIHILLSNYLESRRRIGVVFQIRWVDVKNKGAVTKKEMKKGRKKGSKPGKTLFPETKWETVVCIC